MKSIRCGDRRFGESPTPTRCLIQSVGVMDEPAQVDADAEGKDIQIEGNAAAVIKFKVQVRSRLEIGGGVEAIVADEFCGTGGDAGVEVILAIVGGTA